MIGTRRPRSVFADSASIFLYFERYGGALVALITLLICLPFVRPISLVGDEGIWLHAAQRMLDGQFPYRDFFELHPPVGFLSIYGWLEIFGSTLLAARLFIVAVIALTAWLAFSCCERVSKRPGLSAFLVISWVAASQGSWTQVNHHWLTTLFSMICFWAILVVSGKREWPVIAGLAASAAALVTTHRGGLVVIAALVVLLTRKSLKSAIIYVVSGLSLLALVLIVLWLQGALQSAFEQVILYPIRHYSNIQGVAYGSFRNGQNALLVGIFPVMAILFAMRVWQEGLHFIHRDSWPESLTFAVVGFLGIFPRPDAVHISFSVVLALPLLSGLIDHFVRVEQTRSIYRISSAALLLMFPAVPLVKAAIRVNSAPMIESRAGQFTMLRRDGSIELLERLGEMTPDQKVFVYPYSPIVPFITKLHHPAQLDVFVPQYSTPTQYFDTCVEIIQKSDWVVLDVVGSDPASYRKAFPAIQDASPPEKRMFEKAIRQGFVLDKNFGSFELRRRNAFLPDCSKILQQ